MLLYGYLFARLAARSLKRSVRQACNHRNQTKARDLMRPATENRELLHFAVGKASEPPFDISC